MLRLAKAVAFVIRHRGKVFAGNRGIETSAKASGGVLILLTHISFWHWDLLPALHGFVSKRGVFGRRLVAANEH